ncbi:MAG: hypothetical protein U0559_02265 [Anaerolineae bacterium]
MGIVHHSNYVVWMEEGRSEFMRQKHLDYVAVERSGLSLAVTDVNVPLPVARALQRTDHRPHTWIDSLRSRALTFGYEIINADTRLRLVTGSVKLMLIDKQGNAFFRRVSKVSLKHSAVVIFHWSLVISLGDTHVTKLLNRFRRNSAHDDAAVDLQRPHQMPASSIRTGDPASCCKYGCISCSRPMVICHANY